MLRSKRAWAKWARKSRFRYRYSHTRNMTVPFSIWCAHSSSPLIFLSISYAVLPQCCILFFVLFCFFFFFLKKSHFFWLSEFSDECQTFVPTLFYRRMHFVIVNHMYSMCFINAVYKCTYIYFIRGVLLCIDNGQK